MMVKESLEKTKVTQSSQLVERRSLKLKVLTYNQLSSLPSLKHKRYKDLIMHLQLQPPLQKAENSFSTLHKQITTLLLSNTKFRTGKMKNLFSSHSLTRK